MSTLYLSQVIVGKIAGSDELLQCRLRLPELAFRLGNGSLCLGHLLIQIRSVDFGQQLIRTHPVADVHVAAPEVPGRARKDVRLRNRSDVAWQQEFARLRRPFDFG